MKKPEKFKLPGQKTPYRYRPQYGRKHREHREYILNEHPICVLCRKAFSHHAHSPSHHTVENDSWPICVECHLQIHREERREGR